MKNGNSLPRALAKYRTADYVTKQKALFAFYLSIVLIFCMLVLISTTSYIQVLNPIYGQPYLPVILPQVGVMTIFVLCLVLLIRGYYHIASNLMLISAILAVWIVILFDKSAVLGRLDTLSFVFAALTMAPLLVGKRGFIIFLYAIINILLIHLFVLINQNILEMTVPAVRSYLIDTSVSLFFVGFVGYNIYRINKKAIYRAEEDIKEREDVERELAKSEKRYREMADLLPQTIFETDREGNIKYVNKSGFELFEYSEADLEGGVNLFSTLTEADHEKAMQNIKAVLSGKPSTGYEYTAIKKSGSTFPVRIYSSPVRENDKVIGLRGTIIDISEQKSTEQALKMSEELFRSVIEFMPHPVALTDIDGRYILVNKAFTYDTGYDFEDLQGKTTEEAGMNVDPSVIKVIFEKLTTVGVVENVEMRLKNKSGAEVYLYYSARLIQLLDRTAILSSAVNIGEKKKNEMELEQYRNHLETLVKDRTYALFEQQKKLEVALNDLQSAQKQLIQTEKMASLGLMASGVAHEINNPLNFINGGIYGIENYIKDQLPEHHTRMRPLIEAVHTGVKRSTDIVKSLNRFSRQTPGLKEECDIHSIIDDCLIILYNKIKDRIQIEKQFTDAPALVIGNDGKIHQVFLNIISNAIQAIENKGSITIKTNHRDRNFMVTISDSGIGIASKDLPRVFDAFFTTKLPGSGTGLGLTITYDIIKEVGGSIDITSELGKGTEVVVQLPQHNSNMLS